MLAKIQAKQTQGKKISRHDHHHDDDTY